MGNDFSSSPSIDSDDDTSDKIAHAERPDQKSTSDGGYSEFFSSAGRTIGNATGVVCGSLSDTFDEAEESKKATKHIRRVRSRSPSISSSSRNKSKNKKRDDHTASEDDVELSAGGFLPTEDDESLQTNPMSALFARALLSEVTDNPGSMTPAEMTQREKKLLKAQERAKTASKEGIRPVGSSSRMNLNSRTIAPNLMSENRAQVRSSTDAPAQGKHRITIGLSLSRRHATLGHPETVTRQTSFDFNELQDREYKYVSSTDSSGWRAGGGESGAAVPIPSDGESSELDHANSSFSSSKQSQQQMHKVAAPDTVHIPIIHIDCDSTTAADNVIASIARGEVFIPHMSVLPEALGVNGVSPPDLVVRFGCERNDDIPPEQWPNWCLEFMHNQLYEYFAPLGAQWMKRPFQITLAKKVRWKTVKHMNKFFTESERVINAWRENGPQYLDPQLSYIEGGATPEEVARPHGIYLMRNGRPTNYFPPNFEPPYTTKMTRSLLSNVISKSWDKKRRDWTSEPMNRSVSASLLLSSMCGCHENQGFVAREATNHFSPVNNIIGGDFFGVNGLGEYNGELTSRAMQQHKHLPTSETSKKDADSKKGDGKRGRSSKKSQSTPQDSLSTQRTSSNKLLMSSEETPAHNDANKRPLQLDHRSENMREKDTIQSSTTENFNNGDMKDERKNAKESLPMPTTNINEGNTRNTDHYSSMEEKRASSSISQRRTNLAAEKIPEESEALPTMNNHDYLSGNQESTNDVRIINSNFEEDIAQSQSVTASEVTTGSSIGQSLGIVSVGESQTTVQIMNRSSTKFIEQERERRKEREVEREKERQKMDQLEMAIQEKMKLNQEKISDMNEYETKGREDRSTKGNQSSRSRSSSKKKKKGKKSKKEKKEKSRENTKLTTDKAFTEPLPQAPPQPSTLDVDSRIISDSMNSEKENASKKGPTSDSGTVENKMSTLRRDSSFLPLNLSNDPVTSNPKSNSASSPLRGVSAPYEITSQASMDYSLDTASLLGDGSLIGGQFAGDGSVITLGTNASENRSLLSCVTRSTIHDVSRQNRLSQGVNGGDEDDISLSLMASSSSGVEPVPTDEELFAVGWAKAMDPSSGSYYFFTLDRSTIVWDNPLAGSK